MIGRRDVNSSRFNRFFINRIRRRKRFEAIENLRQNSGDIGRNMPDDENRNRQIFGKLRTKILRASNPPADAPITIMLRVSIAKKCAKANYIYFNTLKK